MTVDEEDKGGAEKNSDEEEEEDEKENDQKDDDKDEDGDEEGPTPTLTVEIRHEDEKEDDPAVTMASVVKLPVDDEAEDLLNTDTREVILDPRIAEDLEFIAASEPTTKLEIALANTLKRKVAHIERLSGEIDKLKAFISKRKQTYKRKRKDEGAPTRALSAYNIFIQDRFARLAKENESALKSADTDAQLKRVPPSSLVASTGNAWKELPAEEKVQYEERAKADRKRYEEQMAAYQPPDKQSNRKRNKTGYNMFFSAHVLRLKQSENGVPSERGSVARLVGNAWKVSSLWMDFVANLMIDAILIF